MADPLDVVPYQDPNEEIYSEELLQLLHIENPTLVDLYPTNASNNNADLHYPPNHIPSVTNGIGEPSNLIHEPFMWSMPGHNPTTDPSNPSNGAAFSNHGEPNVQHRNVIFDNGRTIPSWPIPPSPYSCSFCHVLREIIHTDGINMTKLELHGRVGVFSHAILESPNTPQYQMFDFCKKSIEDVKDFLKQYCEERKQAGYIMMSDPLSSFYEALCVGLVRDGYSDDADDFIESSIASSESENEETAMGDASEPDNSNKVKSPKTALSIQRARTGKMTLLDLAAYFHLPIEEAARRMSMCPTVVKRICRRDGLKRWPHRKIKSIDGRIARLKAAYLHSLSMDERLRVQAEIEKQQQRISEICFGVPRAPG